MKKIWKYLTQHLREDFHLVQYSAVALFLFITIYINYKIDFEDDILDSLPDLTKPFGYFLSFSTAYYCTLLTYSLLTKQKDFWKVKLFWIKSLLVLVVLSVDSSAPYLRTTIHSLFEPQLQYWVYKIAVNLMSYVTIMLPLLLYYYKYDRHEKHVYGLNARQFYTKPYFFMLLIMLPLIIGASFHSSFLNQYP